jgi:putative acyl-CoA dehydrogenase
MPRVYRQLPLLSIWEGSGNVVCLDVLRALQREPESLEVFLDELEPEQRADAEAAVAEADEARARHVVERLAVALQASLLVRHAPAEVADAFRGRTGSAYGTLPSGVDAAAIIDRHRPRI